MLSAVRTPGRNPSRASRTTRTTRATRTTRTTPLSLC